MKADVSIIEFAIMRQIKEALPPGLPWWFYGPPAAPAQRLPPPQAPASVIPGGVPKLAYSVEEAAEALGVSRSLVYRLIH